MFNAKHANQTAIWSMVAIAIMLIMVYMIFGSVDYKAMIVGTPVLVGLLMGALDEVYGVFSV